MGLLLAKHIKDELIEETVKTLNDEEKLLEIVKNDENLFAVRELAAKQITDSGLLKEIIFDTSDTTYNKTVFDIREVAVNQITDNQTLVEVINNYYDDSSKTKYDLNVVMAALRQVNDDEILINISNADYDDEVVNLAVERLNEKFEDLDKTKLKNACDDDSKVKRLWAINQIDDDETLIDIALNAKYLDVRREALGRIGSNDERIISLKDILLKEKDYQDKRNEYIILNKEDEENKQELADKASNLGVEYRRIGNSQKEKFYNEQCKLFENN
ncbi:hypothetical protein [Methanosphaera sp. BMS]|uniref:hypothetical protein n=1 Tax=Methanosphaera sp. BMS TaxID=1789762 RepID=UPI000DC1D60B|nr:hypothetical protein [Methanosphaera sp. BMS]AWX32124.1 hypothetical protein AW729_02980 [Methanosphaera sp. BMS]